MKPVTLPPAQVLSTSSSAWIVLSILISGTVIGIAGIDLVLPAIPSLPEALGSTPARAQLVLASFAGGTGLGLLIFGRLADSLPRHKLLLASLCLYSLSSFAAAVAYPIELLILLRAIQGASGSAAAVFAPGIIRELCDPKRAVRMIGLMGSIESLVPGLAPIAGIWLLAAFGWQGSFYLLGYLAAALALMLALVLYRFKGLSASIRPRAKTGETATPGSYWLLLKNAVFLRYALSHALVLGGILTLVFGAPMVIVKSLGGTLATFVTMQIIAIAAFIVGANLQHKVVQRLGVERVLTLASYVAALSIFLLLCYALAGGSDSQKIIYFFVPLNLAFGLRGPPGFFRAIVAAGHDDARASALLVLAIMGAAALGTGLLAPWIDRGLVALSLATLVLLLLAILIQHLLPGLAEEKS